ncbi:MAG TPA: EamA family transporter [Candidatus Limnocylindria bacterium]|nr:EamA family transporter [Candidatus Limnocylindria bacterium]
MRTDRFLAMVAVALGLVYVVWGSTYFAIAIMVQTLPPLVAAGARFFIAGLALAVWLAVRDRAALRVTRHQLASAALVGILLLAGGNGLVTLGERTVPSGLAALIVASVPLWIVLLRLGAGDRPHVDVVAGVTVGIVGVAVLVVPTGMSGAVDVAGLAMLVGATLSWSVGTFISPRIRMPKVPLASTALQMLAAGVVLPLVAVPLGEYRAIDLAHASAQSVLAFAYLVVFGSIVAFSAYTWLLQHASVSLVSTYAYVNPVIAVFLGTLFLREPLTPTMLAGAALILAAVAFIVTRTATRG